MPAKAGIKKNHEKRWIPVYRGMTVRVNKSDYEIGSPLFP
jgi:hypothetical protein